MHVSQEAKEMEGVKPTMYGLMPGEQIEVTQWFRGKAKSYVCTVIQEQKNFITVDRGNYKDTVDKLLILQKQMKIERIEDMKKIEAPPKEKLLEMAQGPFSRSKTMQDIAKVFKVSPATVYGWFKSYEIDNWSSKEAIMEPVNLVVEKTVDTSTVVENEPSIAAPVQTKVSEKSVQASKLIVRTLQFDHLLIDIDRTNKNVSFIDEGLGQKIDINFEQLSAFSEVALGVRALIDKD